jgi:CheY-like chemotaxis protein
LTTILLAEDDLDDQELFADALSEIDPSINLVSFTSGKKILNHLQGLEDNEIPELIILDYNIPEINGAEILKKLEEDRRYDPMVKVVWSTSNSPTYQNSCLKLGAKAYFVKPSNVSALTHMVKEILSFVN